MTNFEIISVTTQFITFFFLGVSILYYYKQANAAKKQANAASKQSELLTASLERSTYIDFEASLFELSKLIIQYPQIRPYLYDNKPVPRTDHPDYNLVLSFSVFYLDFFDHVLTMERLSPNGTQWPAKKWEAWIEDMFNGSSTIRLVFSKEKHWYIDDLRILFDHSQSHELQRSQEKSDQSSTID